MTPEIWTVGSHVVREVSAALTANGYAASTRAVSTLDELLDLLDATDERPPAAVVVEVEEVDDAARGTLVEVLAVASELGAPVSVLFQRLADADIDHVVYGPYLVDQALEVRGDDDRRDAVRALVEHVGNRLRAPAPADLEIGTVFPVPDDDYQRARRRSLVSHDMGGFSADLRRAVAALRRFPLRTTLPWDPHEGQTPASAYDDRTQRWSLRLTARTTPNLSDLFNTHDQADARTLLDGVGTQADDHWSAAWRSDPPALLLTGESGTGKTLVATVLAQLLLGPVDGSDRPRGRLVKVNCASLTLDMFTHLAMGSAPNFWSGVSGGVPGHFAQAAHGVLFLDELGDLRPEVQTAMLTYLDDRLVRPSGIRPFRAFQHIIAATNRDLEEGVNQQWFRNDLLARLPLRLEIPPLRVRGPDELRQLVDFVVQDPQANPVVQGRRMVGHVSADAVDRLVGRDYRDGNFRELTEVVHAGLGRAITRYSAVLDLEDLEPLDDASSFRADRRADVVEVVAVPDRGLPVVEVRHDHDLRVLARREGRAVLVDEARVHWVLAATCSYRWTVG